MAIGIHIVTTNNTSESGQFVDRVVADGSVPHSAGSPTVKAYLALEAADDYILSPQSQFPSLLITVDAGALNSA